MASVATTVPLMKKALKLMAQGSKALDSAPTLAALQARHAFPPPNPPHSMRRPQASQTALVGALDIMREGEKVPRLSHSYVIHLPCSVSHYRRCSTVSRVPGAFLRRGRLSMD